MVHYSASAKSLLALTCLTATAINADARTKISTVRAVVDDIEQQRLRKLYGTSAASHFVTDVQTKCDEVWAGNPKVCLKVCVEVTTIKSGESVVEETSKVSESKCKESAAIAEVSNWGGDGYTEVKKANYKCVESVRRSTS